ncbi:MAG: YraN family protein [Paramuribaculum sp.]|nr:YraN family protein [Paramuribaculum sp.]
MAKHNTLGRWGEQIAREYLIADGYAIFAVDKNMVFTDIDIVAMKDNEVAFVEVKTRRESSTDPEEVVDKRKRARMVRAADMLIRSYKLLHEPRYDIIIVNGSPETGHTVTHYPDAFLPPLSSTY